MARAALGAAARAWHVARLPKRDAAAAAAAVGGSGARVGAVGSRLAANDARASAHQALARGRDVADGFVMRASLAQETSRLEKLVAWERSRVGALAHRLEQAEEGEALMRQSSQAQDERARQAEAQAAKLNTALAAMREERDRAVEESLALRRRFAHTVASKAQRAMPVVR